MNGRRRLSENWKIWNYKRKDRIMEITPKGAEPANIKKRMDTLFAKLDNAYPDKVIRSLQRDHKHWAETVKELYRLLGYPDGNSFLEAYGYTVQRGEAGRPKTNNYDEVIETLRKRYPDGMPFSKTSEIIAANPDLKGILKTMQNNANELFGMSVKDYFNQIGLFGLGDKKSQLDDLTAKLQQRYPQGTALPNTVAKLKEENPDLPMIRLIYCKEIYGLDVKPYLVQKGLVAVEEKPEPLVSGDTEEERNEAYLRLLTQRYEGKTDLPVKVADLIDANPDIPVRKLNKYIRSKGEQKVERYYIRNRIMQGKDTDLQEYTYCMVSFEKTAWDAGSKQYAYLAGDNAYAPGDMVVVEFGFAGWEIGEVKEVIHCLGIDAPWPVSSTKEILRKACPDEISKGMPILSAEEQAKSNLWFAPGRTSRVPEVDWADAFPEHEESPDGTIPGFVLADHEVYRCKSKIDLRETYLSPPVDVWCCCEFRFRGLAVEVAKLKRYAKQNDIHISWDGSVTEEIREIRVIAQWKTMDLIERFPALKVTGLAEHWPNQVVYVIYSESGFSGITKTNFGGYFDGRHDGGDGRWEWEYDMMERVNVTFQWLQTGGDEHVSYWYPYENEWNRDNYTREMDGRIYIRKMPTSSDFEVENGFLQGYYGHGGDVVVPSSVQDLRKSSFDNTCHAFIDNVSITSVYIPGSVKTIPTFTFLRCQNLKKVVLGEGIVQIAANAFCHCPALTEVVFPESLTEIMPKAFTGCEHLEVSKLKLPDGLQVAGQAFRECADIPKIILGQDKTILLSAYAPAGATELVLPDTITTIGDNALRDLPIHSVCLPKGLRHIGNHVFENCPELVLKELPDTLESIGEYAFYECRSIAAITLPDSVKAVGKHAFSRSVKELHFPEAMTSIPSKCFRDLYGDYQDDPLETVTIGQSTKEIGDDAFYECIHLTHIDIPESVKRIGARALYNCKSLTKLVLPEGLEQLDMLAIYGCKNITNLQIPAGVTVLTGGVVEECVALTSIALPNQLKVIERSALRGCKKLKKIAIPETVEEIGEGAFARCISLESIVLPSAIRSVGKEAFKACDRLTALRIPGTVEEIALGLAQGCATLKTVRIEPGVQKIAGRAFKDCPNLKTVEIPSSVTKIAAKVFEGCPKVVIACEKGSAAEKYAQKNNLQLTYL